jgi:hypothetical protein
LFLLLTYTAVFRSILVAVNTIPSLACSSSSSAIYDSLAVYLDVASVACCGRILAVKPLFTLALLVLLDAFYTNPLLGFRIARGVKGQGFGRLVSTAFAGVLDFRVHF